MKAHELSVHLLQLVMSGKDLKWQIRLPFMQSQMQILTIGIAKNNPLFFSFSA